MKTIITFLSLFFGIIVYSQDYNTMAKNDLIPLKKSFDIIDGDYKKEAEVLKTKTNNLDSDTNSQFNKTLKLKKQLDSINKIREEYINFYTLKKVEKDSLEKFFPKNDYKTLAEIKETKTDFSELKPKTTYILLDNNEIIKEEDLIKNKEVNKVFSKIIDEKSESNLGKFEIPAIGQLIPVYYTINDDYEKIVYYSNSKEINKNKSILKIHKIYVGFEEVNITLYEGAMDDIRVTLIDKSTNRKFYFENRLPASLLRNSYNGKNYNLKVSFISSIDPEKAYINDTKLEKCYIFLKDVLQYEPNSGNNYVPDDQNLIFPKNREEAIKSKTRSVYQLSQNTSLQNTVELRTYTDFLGLFNDSPNGIIQIQGKADFFVNPFRISRKSSVYFFKKITPYVNFSKIEDSNRGLDLEQNITATDTTYTIKSPLQLYEKPFLELGVNLNIVSFKFIKEMPFKVNLYFPLHYYANSVFKDKTDNTNFKIVSYGGGANLEFKKFSNFGFNYSVEYTYTESINKTYNINIPENFWVLKNEAELFYYPNQSKNQSIFTRFRTFYNYVDSRDSFFQFQFGYRFAIGAGKVKG